MMNLAIATLFLAKLSLIPPSQLPLAAQPEPVSAPVYRLGVQAEPAFGVGSGPFFTGLLGVRLDYRFTPAWSVGPYLGYANLKGPAGKRVHNTLLYALLSYEAPLSGNLKLPIRFGIGYLPKNGPYLRSSLGLGYELADDWELSLDAIPAFWSVDDRTELSLGAALGVAKSF